MSNRNEKKTTLGGLVGGLVVAGLAVGAAFLLDKVLNDDKKESAEPKPIEEATEESKDEQSETV